MKREIYLLCGVPGSGKSWVCEQLKDKFQYVSHDANLGRALIPAVLDAAEVPDDRPLLLDCPFAERSIREMLESHGMEVKPVFVVEDTKTVQSRYYRQRGKELPQASVTRSVTIMEKVTEWNAPHGTSDWCLEYLRNAV